MENYMKHTTNVSTKKYKALINTALFEKMLPQRDHRKPS